jgi:hypothetical protein
LRAHCWIVTVLLPEGAYGSEREINSKIINKQQNYKNYKRNKDGSMIYDKDNPNYRGQRELPKELQLTWMVAGG